MEFDFGDAQVELCSQGRLITCDGGGMHAFPAHQGEAPLKRVDRERRMHVKVAKQHARLGAVRDPALRFVARTQEAAVERSGRDLTIHLHVATPEHGPQGWEQQSEEGNRRDASSLPNRHCAGE